VDLFCTNTYILFARRGQGQFSAKGKLPPPPPLLPLLLGPVALRITGLVWLLLLLLLTLPDAALATLTKRAEKQMKDSKIDYNLTNLGPKCAMPFALTSAPRRKFVLCKRARTH
jgi:hypothetical protein